MKNLILFPWRTVCWAEVAFAEELSPQSMSVSQSCAEDRPPFVLSTRVRCSLGLRAECPCVAAVVCDVCYCEYDRTKTRVVLG